jgi:predicted metal-dependent hydrolase
VSLEKSEALILKKARWIIDKLELVKSIGEDDVVTGSRIQYLGRKYYVAVFIRKNLTAIKIEFTESKFKVYTSKALNNQLDLKAAFNEFLKRKAIEKITPRINKWTEETGLIFNELRFRKMEKQWGSCTPRNNIVINTDAVKLPFSLIDYLIVHELVHTKVKNHSKEFWAEVSRWIPNWRELDERMWGMRL